MSQQLFELLLPAVERAHTATRLIAPVRGCRLGASLLAFDLYQKGWSAHYVRGHYLVGHDVAGSHNEHSWVQVAALLLDPTRDQFAGEDYRSDTWGGVYSAVKQTSGSDIEVVLHRFLRTYGRAPGVTAIVKDYGLHMEARQQRLPIRRVLT